MSKMGNLVKETSSGLQKEKPEISCMGDNYKSHHHTSPFHLFSMLVPFLQNGILKTASFSLVFPIRYLFTTVKEETKQS